MSAPPAHGAWTLLLAALAAVCCSLPTAFPGAAHAQSALADGTASSPTVVVEGKKARARLTFYRSDVVRVDWQPTATPGGFAGSPDTSLAVIRVPGEVARRPAVQRSATSGGGRVLRTADLTVAVERDPLRLRFFDGAGRPLASGAPEGAFTTRDTAQALRFAIDGETHFYGTGERRGPVDLRGRAFESYNTQAAYAAPPPVLKINVPLLTTSSGYALFFDSPYPGSFDVGATRANRLRYTAANGGRPARGSLTYYLIAGRTLRRQLDAYTWLTGRQPLPPRWGLGYIQSKFGYRTADAARAAVDTLRQERIPVSALVLDLYWFEHMGDLAWNRDGGWPDPQALDRDLEDAGVKLITITEPFLSQRSDLYDEAVAGGYVGERPGGGPYVIDDWWSCGPDAPACKAALVDVTDPQAQDWWWQQYTRFMEVGVDGFWTDLGEPERHPRAMQHAMGPAARVHNVYDLLWAKTLYEGYQDWRPNQRLLNLTRSGFAGIQRYGTFLWSGDTKRSFAALHAQVPLLLNVGLSGLGYYSSDLGGFKGDLYSPELYARWLQMGAFTPTMRAHGQDNLPTEPWGFGKNVEQIVRRYIRLRYRMLPYNYALARQNHEHGTPLARPLFFDAAGGALARVGDAFMWGDALLVAPVTQQGRRAREVRLPEGSSWTNYWTGERRSGGATVQVDAPLGRLPLFVKAGSIIPMRASARPMAAPFDTLQLDLFPDARKAARFTLYEDDGTTQNYRRGAYAKTRIVQDWQAQDGGAQDGEGEARGDARPLRLRIGPASGHYDGLPTARLWRADVRHVAAAPSGVRFDGRALPERASREALYASEGGYFYDASARRLVVQQHGATDRAHQMTARGVRLAL